MKAPKARVVSIAVVLGFVGSSNAAVTAEEAARLGTDLTPWGAEVAGNKEGTIPPYTGGLPTDLMGPNWDSNKSIVNGRQVQPDPFKDEKPLYRITATNLAQYADKLSEATKALFRNDPNFYMDVFPTHRVVNYPKYFLESSIRNATRCKMDADGETMRGCKGGMPFPIPKTGIEAIMNLQMGAYFGPGFDVDVSAIYVDRKGSVVTTATSIIYYQSPFQDPRYSVEDFENTNNPYAQLSSRTILWRTGPPRITGEAGLYFFSADNRNSRSWAYQPGNRRVRLSPNVEYDFPIASSAGASFYDEVSIFQGRKDKFDWKLIGKKEMIIPYSNYRLAYGDKDKALMAGHPNPEYTRWELHRTWVVEATVKPSTRHVFAKRRYYIDEDSPASAMGDNWNAKGEIVRGNYQSTLWIWDYQVNFPYFWNSDLVSGTFYTAYHPGNGTERGVRFRNPNTGFGGNTPDGKMVPESGFTPEALSRRTQR